MIFHETDWIPLSWFLWEFHVGVFGIRWFIKVRTGGRRLYANNDFVCPNRWYPNHFRDQEKHGLENCLIATRSNFKSFRFLHPILHHASILQGCTRRHFMRPFLVFARIGLDKIPKAIEHSQYWNWPSTSLLGGFGLAAAFFGGRGLTMATIWN